MSIEKDVNNIADDVSKVLLDYDLSLNNYDSKNKRYGCFDYFYHNNKGSVCLGNLRYSLRSGKKYVDERHVRVEGLDLDNVLITPICDLLLFTKGNYDDEIWKPVRLASIRVKGVWGVSLDA